MNIQNIIHQSWRWFLHTVAMQLFLTLISLPILTAWGLPISYLTPIGTLLFTPVLTIYLCCALAVFITTLCYIPNSYCIYALQLVSRWWLWALSLIRTPWQIGFVAPPLILLCCIPVTACVVVWYLRKKTLRVMVGGLLALLIGWIFILRLLPTVSTVHVEHTNKKTITAFYDNDYVTVLDLESSCSAVADGSGWILYHTMPEITKKTGAAHIDRFIVVHPRQRTFEALTNLCKKGVIHDIYLPRWEGHIPWRAWCAYKELKETVTAYGYTVYYLHCKKPLQIDSTHQLVPTETEKKYSEARYKLFTLETINDKKSR